jgi:rubrerythrin
MKREGMQELLYQALETEMGGVQVYEHAIQCADNEELKEEWEEYLEQTKRHERILRGVFQTLGLDSQAVTPGRMIVREKGAALVAAMQKALKEAPEAAEIVAAECVVDAETKDHMNWELIGALADELTGKEKKTLKEAYDSVEDEEDEHLYHTMGWTRELWLDTLGLPAELPPPEEEKDVKTASEAAKVKEQRQEKLKKAARSSAQTSSSRGTSARSSTSRPSSSRSSSSGRTSRERPRPRA